MQTQPSVDSPIVQLKIDKGPKLGLSNIVLLLFLTIYLQIKDNKELSFDAKKVAK